MLQADMARASPHLSNDCSLNVPTKAATIVFRPPGSKYDLHVSIPDGGLAVCGKCKKDFKSRRACRSRSGHTDPPWCSTYLCVMLDDSCVNFPASSSERLSLVDYPLEVKQVHNPYTQYNNVIADSIFDAAVPCCTYCKIANRSRFACRSKDKHTHLPWTAIFVTVGRTDHWPQTNKPHSGMNIPIAERSQDIRSVHPSRMFLIEISFLSISLQWLIRKDDGNYNPASVSPLPSSSSSLAIPSPSIKMDPATGKFMQSVPGRHAIIQETDFAARRCNLQLVQQTPGSTWHSTVTPYIHPYTLTPYTHQSETTVRPLPMHRIRGLQSLRQHPPSAGTYFLPWTGTSINKTNMDLSFRPPIVESPPSKRDTTMTALSAGLGHPWTSQRSTMTGNEQSSTMGHLQLNRPRESKFTVDPLSADNSFIRRDGAKINKANNNATMDLSFRPTLAPILRDNTMEGSTSGLSRPLTYESLSVSSTSGLPRENDSSVEQSAIELLGVLRHHRIPSSHSNRSFTADKTCTLGLNDGFLRWGTNKIHSELTLQQIERMKHNLDQERIIICQQSQNRRQVFLDQHILHHQQNQQVLQHAQINIPRLASLGGAQSPCSTVEREHMIRYIQHLHLSRTSSDGLCSRSVQGVSSTLDGCFSDVSAHPQRFSGKRQHAESFHPFVNSHPMDVMVNIESDQGDVKLGVKPKRVKRIAEETSIMIP